jgi:hypothetical protein
MHNSSRWDLEHVSLKCANYWQSVLRFGLPFIILYRGIDYAGFRMTTHRVGVSYPWRTTVIAMDIALVFFVSAIWWGLMRQLVAWKRKSQEAGPPSTPRSI